MKFIEIAWEGKHYAEEIRLRDELLRRPLGLCFTPEQLAEENQHWHFGVLEQDALIACVVVVPLEDEHAKVRQMAVAEAFHRKGVGSLLIQHVEKLLALRGVQTIELNAREPVIGFYENLGYASVGPRFTEVTIEHQKMTKKLEG